MSVACARQGCGLPFSPETNPSGACSFHPGAPDFHEGLKGWSCCKDINKPVMEFDQFMKIPGCAKSTHLVKEDKPASAPKAPVASTSSAAPSSVSNGVETYGAPPPAAPKPSATAANTAVASLSTAPAAPSFVEEIDDPSTPVPPGATCKRTSCKYALSNESTFTALDRETLRECSYHPGQPVFREGSKGYTCCKRRVLDFDDFLKMAGCTTAKSGHLFVGAKKEEGSEKELVDARVDHYQTPALVHASVFAKKVDPNTSTITFNRETVELDLNLPTARVSKTLRLYAPIDPSASTFKVLGTKVDLTLVKEQGGSWPVLEQLAEGVALPKGYALTFGVGKH